MPTYLLEHLATTRPGNRTHCEQHLFSQEDLWQNLEDCSKADSPVLLWHYPGEVSEPVQVRGTSVPVGP